MTLGRRARVRDPARGQKDFVSAFSPVPLKSSISISRRESWREFKRQSTKSFRLYSTYVRYMHQFSLSLNCPFSFCLSLSRSLSLSLSLSLSFSFTHFSTSSASFWDTYKKKKCPILSVQSVGKIISATPFGTLFIESSERKWPPENTSPTRFTSHRRPWPRPRGWPTEPPASTWPGPSTSTRQRRGWCQGGLSTGRRPRGSGWESTATRSIPGSSSVRLSAIDLA